MRADCRKKKSAPFWLKALAASGMSAAASASASIASLPGLSSTTATTSASARRADLGTGRRARSGKTRGRIRGRRKQASWFGSCLLRATVRSGHAKVAVQCSRSTTRRRKD